MQKSVLTLGEKIILASRLASIEHVRQEIEAIEHARRHPLPRDASSREAGPVGDRTIGFTEEPEAVAFSKPVPALLGDVFRRLEATTPMPRERKRGAA